MKPHSMSAAEFQAAYGGCRPRTASPRRQLAGLSSKKVGQEFEKLLNVACEYYLAQGIARVKKVPEPFVMEGLEGGGTIRGHYASPAEPDYGGTIAGGRAVWGEAKITMTSKIHQSVVTDEQADALQDHENLGAHSFLIVCLGFKAFYRVPWHVWRDMKKLFGHKYMAAAELDPYSVPYRSGVVLFLEGLL